MEETVLKALIKIKVNYLHQSNLVHKSICFITGGKQVSQEWFTLG